MNCRTPDRHCGFEDADRPPPKWASASNRPTLFKTRDPHDAVTQVASTFCPHTLRVMRSDASFELALTRYESQALKMVDLSYGAPVKIAPDPFHSFLLITTARAGRGSARAGRRDAAWTPSRTLLLAADARNELEFAAGFQQRTVSVSRQAFTGAWLSLTGRPLRRSLDFGPVALSEPAQLHWTRLSSLIHGLFESRSMNPILAANLGDCALGVILGTMRVVFDVGSDDRAAAAVAVRRAEEFIASFAHEPIAIAEIAVAAGCGYRSLQNAFQRHRGMTPKQFLTKVRLSRAREALLSGTPGASVTKIALDNGFCHLSRFAQLYQTTYGELPSATMRRRT